MAMKDPMIVPRLEPEVVQAGARRFHGDDEKVPTTALKGLTVVGVSLSSRYDKAHELEMMARVISDVEPRHAAGIETFFCDSKAGSTYQIILRGEIGVNAARETVRALNESIKRHNGGHNGIWVDGPAGVDLTCDPDWIGDLE